MSIYKGEQLLETLKVVQKQLEREEVIREKMLDILEENEIEEDEMPQNSNLAEAVEELLKNEENPFVAIEKLDLDYLEIQDYKCFKVDSDTTGDEYMYFISPTETLCLM